MCVSFFTYLFSSLSVLLLVIGLSKILNLTVRNLWHFWFSSWSLAKQLLVLLDEVRGTSSFCYRFGYELCDCLLEKIFSFVRVLDDGLKLLLEMLKIGHCALHPLPEVIFHYFDTESSCTFSKSLRNVFHELFSVSNLHCFGFINILRLIHFFSIRYKFIFSSVSILAITFQVNTFNHLTNSLPISSFLPTFADVSRCWVEDILRLLHFFRRLWYLCGGHRICQPIFQFSESVLVMNNRVWELFLKLHRFQISPDAPVYLWPL